MKCHEERYRLRFIGKFLGMMNALRERKRIERPKSKKKSSLQACCFEDKGVLDGIQCCRDM